MRNLLTFLTAVAWLATASAQKPSAESIDALLTVTRAEQMVDATLVNVDQVMRQSIGAGTQGQTLDAEQRRALDALPGKFAAVMRDELAWSKMKPVYVQIYEESFTQEEIDGLIAFYRSPAGAAFVEKMPVVMQKTIAVMQSRMVPLMEKMKAATQQALAEAKAAKP